MGVSFLKTGAASQQLAKQEEVKAQIRKEEGGKMFRFWMNKGESAKITFVDGDLDDNGFLNPPRYYEHVIFINGEWKPFVCPEQTMPESGEKCPLCEAGDRAALVALFTIIDHREQKSKDGTKTYVNQRRLYVAKTGTFEILAKAAVKRGGLAGATFEVSRIGDKAPNVGSQFEFEEKNTADVLKKKYTRTVKDPKTNSESTVTAFESADYEKEIVYRTGDEMRKMGLGGPKGSTSTATQPTGPTEDVDYGNEL